MPEPVKYKRQLRNFLIHKPLQKEYTLLMIGIMMVSTLIVASIIHGTMKEAVLGNPYYVGRRTPYEILSQVNELLILRISFTLFACVVVATIIGIVFLHRVAGPVYRFRLILKKLIVGDIPGDITLRDRDYFKEVAIEFNNLFKCLRDKKLLAKEMSSDLDKLANDVSASSQGIVRELKEKLQKF